MYSKSRAARFCCTVASPRTTKSWVYFHNLTELSWLADATIPVSGDWARAEIIFSCAGIVMLLFSAMFHSSKDYLTIMKTTVRSAFYIVAYLTDIKCHIVNAIHYKCHHTLAYCCLRCYGCNGVRTHRDSSNDQESWITWMKNARVELVPIRAKLLNTLSWSWRPNFHQTLTDRCHIISICIPTNVVYHFRVPLWLRMMISRINWNKI